MLDGATVGGVVSCVLDVGRWDGEFDDPTIRKDKRANEGCTGVHACDCEIKK